MSILSCLPQMFGTPVFSISGRMDIIIKNKVKLIRWLSANLLILQHVHSKKLITTDEYTGLKNIADPCTQITELLDLILRKGGNFCIKFLSLLKEDDVNECSPDLRKWITTNSGN